MSKVTTGPFVHPSALCENRRIGAGTRIWAFAHVMEGVAVGADCNIGEHVFLERGCAIGDRVTIKNHVCVWDGVRIESDVFIGPGVLFTNDRYPRSPRSPAVRGRYAHPENWREPTVIGHGASLGAGAIILCGITVGAFAAIGAGAIVTRNVPAHALIIGQPGRCVGWVCACGQKLGNDLCCETCGRTYETGDDGLRTQPFMSGRRRDGEEDRQP